MNELLNSTWVWVAGIILGSLAVFRWIMKSLVFRSMRLSKEQATALYEHLKTTGRTIIFSEEVTKKNLPTIFDALCWTDVNRWLPFRFHAEERLLRAGPESTDSVVLVTALRWKLRTILSFIVAMEAKDDKIRVSVLQSWDADQIGSLQPASLPPPLFPVPSMEIFEKSIKAVINGTTAKTSALLWGPPGNGKSYYVRYLATHFQLPIYLIVLKADIDNQRIIRMFRYVEGPAIVLFEDFDCYFSGRTPLQKDAQYTFDALLNVLDGTYATLEKVITIFTCNNLDSIDAALKYRPGRLRYTIEVPNPSTAECVALLQGQPKAVEMAEQLGSCSLDEILALRDAAACGDGSTMLASIIERRSAPVLPDFPTRERRSRRELDREP